MGLFDSGGNLQMPVVVMLILPPLPPTALAMILLPSSTINSGLSVILPPLPFSALTLVV
jgi:hypothetical protein